MKTIFYYFQLNTKNHLLSLILGSTGAAGPRLFTIHLIDANTDNLPKAHTWYVNVLKFYLKLFSFSEYCSCN